MKLTDEHGGRLTWHTKNRRLFVTTAIQGDGAPRFDQASTCFPARGRHDVPHDARRSLAIRVWGDLAIVVGTVPDFWWTRYRLGRLRRTWREILARKVADLLPARVVYFATIRLWARATVSIEEDPATGHWSQTNVPSLEVSEALARWEYANGLTGKPQTTGADDRLQPVDIGD